MTETTPVTTPIIEVVDGNVVHKTRTGKLFRPDTVHANKNINFVARRDEVVGLVGESGCGKSTLARVMVGLQPLTSGKILFKGVPLKPRGAQRKQLGQSVSVVFQDPATSLNPRMSVHDQLLDPLKVHGVGDHASRENESASWSVLWVCRNRLLTYSPGKSPAVSASASPSLAHWRWNRT